MRKVLGAGITLAAAAYVITYALHLLNRSSDAAVAAGYLIMIGLLAGAGGIVRRFRGRRNRPGE